MYQKKWFEIPPCAKPFSDPLRKTENLDQNDKFSQNSITKITSFAHGGISKKIFMVHVCSYDIWKFKPNISPIFYFERVNNDWFSHTFYVKFLSPEKMTQKKAEQFFKISILEWQNWSKHQFCQNCPVPNGFVCITPNSRIQELKFFKIAQLFCASFSGERKFERKFKTQKSDLSWFSTFSSTTLLSSPGVSMEYLTLASFLEGVLPPIPS